MNVWKKIRLAPICVCTLCLAAIGMVIYSPQDWWTPALVMIGAAYCLAYLDRTERMFP